MKRPTRALLLAAGLGTRLRPATIHTPKCLVPIAGKPLLGLWLNTLQALGCKEVLINTHYLADQVVDFVKNWQSKEMVIKIVYEPELLGTAGTLCRNLEFFEGSTGLLIHADNVMLGKLDGLLQAHERSPDNCILTMLTFNTDKPESCGIVETDSDGVLIDFHEKIKNPPGNCANGALYVFDKSFCDFLYEFKPVPTDFSTEVIPMLFGRIKTWHTHSAYLDIGTQEALDNAQKLFAVSQPSLFNI